jgi:predicted CXXCH cytochrome family protein
MDKKAGLGKILIGVVIVTIVSIGALIGARMIIAPSFSAVDGDYRYQWHRVANEQEWKDFKVKHQGNSYCKGCHSDQDARVAASDHAKVQCENCHGAAFNHPENPKKLSIDKGRGLCLRCHASLQYRPATYAELLQQENRPQPISMLKMINPDTHNPDMACVSCHDAHKAGFK